MKQLINKLAQDFPDITIQVADSFYWSPELKTVFIDTKNTTDSGKWSLLHEFSHALLDHTTYTSDIELLQLESQAWHKAKQLALAYNVTISDDYSENCLDSYRDWLHTRSTCPQCSNRSLQQDHNHYQCFNCLHVWKVSKSRMCRPYRLSAAHTISSS